LVLLLLALGWLIGWSNHSSLSFSFLYWSSPALPVFFYYLIFLFVGLFMGLILGRLVKKK